MERLEHGSASFCAELTKPASRRQWQRPATQARRLPKGRL
ncbi:hypothetical protein CSE45_1317 [Citreicella sp. SE45]|nr:hypothetical protein CSE45_1317 [Citreicella sp. SE45]